MGRNCLIKHVIDGKREGKTKVLERRGRRCKHLFDDFKAKRKYWKLKEGAVDRKCGGLALEKNMDL